MARKFSFGDVSNDNLIIGVLVIIILISIFVMFSLSQDKNISSGRSKHYVTSSDYPQKRVTSSDYPQKRVTSSDYN